MKLGKGAAAALLCAAILAIPAAAQPRYPRNHVFVGGGGGLPQGELQPYLATSPLVRWGYGYRFHRNFQADVGMDIIFHAASVKAYYQTQVGDLRIKDYQYLVPMGGRAILPVGRRVEIHGGGGGAYLRYSERVRQPFGNSGYRIDCPVCASRSGWGYYGMGGLSVALDRYQQFRLGFSSRVFRAATSGDALGSLPGIRTKDMWVNTAAEFSFVF
ncbi:MAG: outer membrane beta-barrel protein [Bryobacteraceae bacterium]